MSSPWGNVTADVYTELGSWGLPTIDAEGMAALTLLRVVDIPFTVTAGASRSMTAANMLPVVIFDKGDGSTCSPCAGLASLVSFLASDVSLPDPNKSLTSFMVAESTAFLSLIESRFGPALLFELFSNNRNYAVIYHTLLEKERSFPLNRILPFLRRNEINRSLSNQTSEALYFNAGVALAALSTRLGDGKKFFYGNEPTVLDAIVFGYLSSIMYTPLPSSQLREQISSFKNLVDFIRRIKDLYFSGEDDGVQIDGQFDAEALAEKRKEDAQNASRHTTEGGPTENPDSLSNEEKERRRRNSYFIWGSVAAFATHVLLGNEIELDIS